MANSQIITKPEIWKPIPNFPGYEISNRGRVRSFWKRGQGTWNKIDIPQRIRQPSIEGRGYLQISLWKNGKNYCRLVHRLVLFAFIGPRPSGMEACHYDGIRTNNFLENLRWDTPANNGADTKRHGSQKGIKNPGAKLNDGQIIQIRELVTQGYPQREIAKMFGITQANISRIITGKAWRHII